MGTRLERISRFTMRVKLDGFRRRLKSVPLGLRKTMTCDQGSELALHQQLSAALKIDIDFCDAHSPWQRGANENTNGLVREFLPKGMDLSQVSHQQLTHIAIASQRDRVGRRLRLSQAAPQRALGPSWTQTRAGGP